MYASARLKVGLAARTHKNIIATLASLRLLVSYVFPVGWVGGYVVELRNRADGVAESRVGCDVVYPLPTDVDFRLALNGGDVLFSCTQQLSLRF